MQEDKNYCVYLHRNKKTNEVFYVGSGRHRRINETRGRCPAWYVVVNADGFVSEILYDDLTKAQSLEKEGECYDNYSSIGVLVNSVRPSSPLCYCAEEFNKELVYCESSPTFLRWRTGGSNKANKRIIGEPAGGISSGYGALRIGGKYHSIHRIIWTMFHGDIGSGLVVDHIDGNPLNNRLANLRVITQSQNSRNTKRLKSNTSGVVGVSLHTNKNRKTSRWCAYFVNTEGKEFVKYFSILKYGKEEAFRLACEWRAEQIRLLNEQGAGYTERHGT